MLKSSFSTERILPSRRRLGLRRRKQDSGPHHSWVPCLRETTNEACHIPCHVILSLTLWGTYQYPPLHFVHGKIEAQRKWLTCPVSELISGKTPRAGWEPVLFLVTVPTKEMTMKGVVALHGIYAALSIHGSIFRPVSSVLRTSAKMIQKE